MASSGVDHIPGGNTIEASETTIEIKIKTLDSQTYTLRVDKQMPVPALKEQIASVTGVLSEQQRLICRGRVLKDDQLLSAYHVEDGHTLHMVVRQPIPPSSEALPNHPGNDPASTSRHTHQIAPGIVIETFSLPSQGDGPPPPEISRILSAVLGSIGIVGHGTGIEGMENRENISQRPERASGPSNVLDASNGQSEQTGLRASADRQHGTFGQAAGFSSLQPPVIPDSLTTLNQYLTNIQREFEALGRDGGSSGHAGTSQPAATASGSRQGFPTPSSLAEVITSARQLLTNQAAEALLQLERQLENQASVTDSSARLSTQAGAMRTGALVHNLGSFLLELGRTIMTLRMGQSPSEAVVNAGPAVFISPNGPNPIMVQALPFQVGTSFGSIPMGAVQSAAGLANGLATGYIPRRIDIQIRRGSPSAPAAATVNANREEQGNTQQPPGQRIAPAASPGENPSNQGASRTMEGPGLAGESGVRVVPLRNMVSALPGSFGRLSSDQSGNAVGLYYPVLGRFQHVVAGERGAQASHEHHPSGPHPEQQSLESHQRPVGDLVRDGSSQTPNTSQNEPACNFDINVVSTEEIEADPEREISGSIQLLGANLFPGGEINLEDGGLEEVAAGSAGPDQARASGGTEVEHDAEPIATDEGIFLSSLLCQLMPLISGQAGLESESDAVPLVSASEPGMALDPSTQAESSSAGASRRADDEPGSPNSKRQKTSD